MLNNLLILPLIALILTVIVEVFIAILFGFKGKNRLLVVVLVSVITNPVLNIFVNIIALFFGQVSIYFILFLELVVILVEYSILVYVYGKIESKSRLFLLSFTMNAISYIFGLLVFDKIVALIQ